MKAIFLSIAAVVSFVAAYCTKAQDTAFTYQGRLNDGGRPANGSYDFMFTLFGTNDGGSSIAGSITNSSTPVNSGLFTVPLDFGNPLDNGFHAYALGAWLEIAVRSNGVGAFSTLLPRQQLTSSPSAVCADWAAHADQATTANSANSAPPVAGSGYYIQNQSANAQTASFNITGDASIVGNLTAGSVTVPAPINSSDAANKAYVDSAVSTVKVPLVSSLPPANAANAGLMLFDTTSNALMICDGTAWNAPSQRHLFWSTGQLEVGWTSVSATPVAVSGRSVTFAKLNSASRLRIAYSDNIGLNTAAAGATWEVKLDGSSVSPTPLVMSLYDGISGGSVMLQPGSLMGYATGVAPGSHTLTVYVSAPGYSGVNTYTGWKSTFLLEVEEIP
jgi:hypothetical protein